MLNFFRQYQKGFFLVIATVVIFSFVFFGTYSTFQTGSVRSDRVVGKTIDGKDLKLSEISALTRVLATDQEDILNGSRNAPPNLLNDGVIRKDILAGGLATVLVEGNYEALEGDLAQRVQRVKTYRSYEHPETSFLSAKAVWQRLIPQVNAHSSLLQSGSVTGKEAFAHLVELYQLQSQLPAEWLRKILLMQQQQYSWLHADPALSQGDMALFGFHSLSDWFGKNFVDLSAQFIYNAAIAAEEKGYKISLEEAKIDLRRNFSEAVKKYQAAKIPVDLTYQDQLRILGMDEAEVAGAWRKVLLFRSYFADMGNSVFLDRMAHEEFYSVASEEAVIDVYKWPSVLTFNQAYPLYAFQTYLKSVAAPQPSDDLALPKTFLSVSEIEKKSPKLVATPFKAKVYAVDKREVALKASIQQVWNFEMECWSQLKSTFPELLGAPAKTDEERFAILEKLEPAARSKVDAYARQLLLGQHDEWVTEALDKANGEEKTFFLSAGKIELPYIDDSAKLGALFVGMKDSFHGIPQFESKMAFFRFENIEKISEAKVKTFEEAMNDHSLTELVDQALEAEFPNLRTKLPEEKAAKGFSYVKEEIAEALLGNLKKQMGVAFGSPGISFAPQRMAVVAASALKDLQKDPNDPSWLANPTDEPLVAQFKLQKTEKHISRTAKEDWMSQESFTMIPDQWSPIHIAEDGDVMFMYLKTRQLTREPILQQLTAGRQVLSSDVKRVLANNILRVMQKKQAVIIPLQPEQE